MGHDASISYFDGNNILDEERLTRFMMVHQLKKVSIVYLNIKILIKTI